MKTTCISMLLMAAFSISSYAQNYSSNEEYPDSRSKLLVGLKAGVNISNVYDSQGEDFQADSKAGFVGGAFLSIPIGKFLGLQPEVLFSQKGFKGTGTLLGSSYDLTRTTNYLDIPVLLSIKPAKQLSILAGPQFSYLVKQRDVFKNSATSVQQEEVFENANIRKNTLCLLGGVDLLLHPAVVLSGRVGWDIQKNNGDGSSSVPRYKNVWLQATLGFRMY